MKSPVHELQLAAKSNSTSIAELLRMCKIVAVKLRLSRVDDWVEQELNGYEDASSLPSYRKLACRIRVKNPVTQAFMPVTILDPEMADHFSRARVVQSVASLQEFLAQGTPSAHLPLSNEERRILAESLEDPHDVEWFHPVLEMHPSQLAGILDAVRNRVLDWSLNLEQEGILGQGFSFSEAEQGKASNAPSVINITGVQTIGNVVGSATQSTINHGQLDTLDADLVRHGFTPEQRNEISQMIRDYQTASQDQKWKKAASVAKWAVEQSDKLGALGSVVLRFVGMS